MSLKKINPIFWIIAGAMLLYIKHKSVVLFFGLDTVFSQFAISLEILYFFFTLASVLIVFVLLKVKKRNFDQVGMTFMGLITVKLAAFFFIFKPLIAKNEIGNNYETINFLVIFLAFLIFETLVSTQILKSADK